MCQRIKKLRPDDKPHKLRRAWEAARVPRADYRVLPQQEGRGEGARGAAVPRGGVRHVPRRSLAGSLVHPFPS